MLATASHHNSFAKFIVKALLLIALLLTMAFAFAKSTLATPHAQSSHAYQMACSGINAPECG